MMKLRLEDWSHLSQIFAAIVVVASLAYVALEIDQNTNAVQAAAYQALITNLTEVDLAVVTNPHLDRIITLGEKSPGELTPEEWSTFLRYSLARTGQLELAYLSYTDNTLNEIQWAGVEVFIPSVLCLPGYRQFWAENQASVFSPVFVNYVNDNVIPKCPTTD